MTPAYDGALGEVAAGHETLSSPLHPGPDHRHHLPLVGVLHQNPGPRAVPTARISAAYRFHWLKKMINDQKKYAEKRRPKRGPILYTKNVSDIYTQRKI